MARRKRKRKKKPEGNMDSLLDTMTSVVGILIILLIVIQMGVKEKIKEWVLDENSREISVEEIQQKASDLEKLKTLIDKKEKYFLSKNSAFKASMMELKKVEKDKSVAVRDLLAVKAVNSNPTKITAELNKSLKEIQLAQAKLAELEIDEKKMKSLIAAYKKKKKTPDKAVKMPNPRPAPPGAKQVTIICRGGRVYFRDDDKYREYFKKKIDFARIKPNKNGEYDQAQIKKYFSRLSPIAPFGKFQPREHPTNIHFNIAFSKSVGESSNSISSRFSRFQKGLQSLDTKKQFIVFQVRPDSYELYLKARALAEKAGFACGWNPQTNQPWDFALWTHMVVLGGKKKREAAKKNPPKKPNNVLD